MSTQAYIHVSVIWVCTNAVYSSNFKIHLSQIVFVKTDIIQQVVLITNKSQMEIKGIFLVLQDPSVYVLL